jgi:hypothetical protein
MITAFFAWLSIVAFLTVFLVATYCLMLVMTFVINYVLNLIELHR